MTGSRMLLGLVVAAGVMGALAVWRIGLLEPPAAPGALGVPAPEFAPADATADPTNSADPAPVPRTFYKWTDADGVVHYANRAEDAPPGVPPLDVDRLGGRVLVETAVETPSPAPEPADGLSSADLGEHVRSLPPEAAGRFPRDRVDVFTSRDCPHSKALLAHLQRRGAATINYDVTDDRLPLAAVRPYLGDQDMTPVAVFGGEEILVGYDEQSVDEAIDRLLAAGR